MNNGIISKSIHLSGPKLWEMVTKLLNTTRLGKKRIIEGDEFHEPHIDLLFGKDGWVEHIDGDIRYYLLSGFQGQQSIITL